MKAGISIHYYPIGVCATFTEWTSRDRQSGEEGLLSGGSVGSLGMFCVDVVVDDFNSSFDDQAVFFFRDFGLHSL